VQIKKGAQLLLPKINNITITTTMNKIILRRIINSKSKFSSTMAPFRRAFPLWKAYRQKLALPSQRADQIRTNLNLRLNELSPLQLKLHPTSCFKQKKPPAHNRFFLKARLQSAIKNPKTQKKRDTFFAFPHFLNLFIPF